MKARLIPMFFGSEPSPEFTKQLSTVAELLSDVAEILSPVRVGSAAANVDAVLVPEMLGEAYRRVEELRRPALPILVITSEFGTVAMWDWEINSYLRDAGITVYAPYNLAQAKLICKGLALKNEMRKTRFLVFQDNPGEGFQASIFKRFYWWEQECSQRMFDKFGIRVERRSFRELGAKAQAIPDEAARETWAQWKSRLKIGPMPERSLLSALKVYIAVKQEIDEAGAIAGAGINCLNESHFSDSTPCLAWNMLYEERRLIWGCEADTVSMLTKYLVNAVLDVPVMMTNMYPFIMGDAALKHERIPSFPKVASEPDNHLLAAHCGYFGVVPQSFSTSWSLERKVLAIVNDNATAIDARMPVGPITLVKLSTSFDAISVARGEIESYARYKNSDCMNGAVIKVADGPRLVDNLASHHYIVTTGDNRAGIDLLAKLFDLEVVSY
ncbi:MAG TPA: hypothetical protein VMV68_02155 [Spirochaetia bacterium]|nr:hypothetical protein [Spirochaetia bacterium]